MAGLGSLFNVDGLIVGTFKISFNNEKFEKGRKNDLHVPVEEILKLQGQGGITKK